jgi:hypothetical protein
MLWLFPIHFPSFYVHETNPKLYVSCDFIATLQQCNCGSSLWISWCVGQKILDGKGIKTESIHMYICDWRRCFCFQVFSVMDNFNPLLNKSCVQHKASTVYAWTGPESSWRLKPPGCKTTDMWRWKGCQPYALATIIPQEIFLVLVSFTGCIDPWALVQPEESCKWKISMTPPGYA